MKAILIAYDLYKSGQQWPTLDDLIKKTFPQHWRCLQSTWLVGTDLSPDQVKARLSRALDDNDELLVAALSASGLLWQGRETWPDWVHSAQTMLPDS